MRCRPLLILQRHKYRTLKPLLDKVGILTARIKQILTFRIIKIIRPEKIKLRRTLIILQMPGKISRNQKRDNQYRNMEKSVLSAVLDNIKGISKRYSSKLPVNT